MVKIMEWITTKKSSYSTYQGKKKRRIIPGYSNTFSLKRFTHYFYEYTGLKSAFNSYLYYWHLIDDKISFLFFVLV